jgi:rhodanese-related sulfurtransferase
MKIFAFLALLGLTAATTALASDTKVIDIDQADLQAAIASKKVTLLDVNGSESYKAGHIPGAIDFIANRDDIAKLLPADKNALVVAYCGNVHCTAYRQAAYAALDLGYTNVRHFAPGIQGWRESGAPTEKASGQ